MPDRYVVPTGGATSGAGGIGAPWTFVHALAAGNTLPGETIFMRAGTYVGPFISFLQGTSDNYIVVRPYPGEAVKIDCAEPVSIPADTAQPWALPAAAQVSRASPIVIQRGNPLTTFLVNEVWWDNMEVDAIISHTAFVGKVLIINFGARFCVPCEWMLADFVPLYHKYAPTHPFDILYVRTDTVAEVRQSGAEHSVPFHMASRPYGTPIYWDYTVAPAGAIPITVIIDKQGVVRFLQSRYSARSTIEAIIDVLLAECFLLVQLSGGYVVYRDIEFLWSYASRPAGTAKNSRYRPTGFALLDSYPVNAPDALFKPGIKLVNCVFHDLGTPAEWGASGRGAEIYGCLFYNNGWDDPAELHSDLYVRNDANSGGFLIEDNILANGYGLGARATHRVVYNSGTDTSIHNITLRGNALLNKGINSAAQKLKDNIFMAGNTDVALGVVEENYTFHPLAMTTGSGYTGYSVNQQNQNLTLRENVFVGGKNLVVIPYYSGGPLSFQNNRLYGTQRLIRAGPLVEFSPGTGDFSSNTYYNYSAAPQAFELEGATPHNNPTQWQTDTMHVGGELGTIFDASPPTGKWIYVRPNKYQAKRAHIIIYNWDNSATVDVDIGQNLLEVGETYEIRNAQNIYGPVVAGSVWNGGPITIQVDNLPAAALTGQAWDATHPETPRSRTFNAFVLTGGYNGALRFLGDDSTASVATIVDGFGSPPTFTIEAKIKFKAIITSPYRKLVWWGGEAPLATKGFCLGISNEGRLQLQTLGPVTAVRSQATLNPFTWYKIAATFNGTTPLLYLNGAAATTEAVATSWEWSAPNLRFGQFGDSASMAVRFDGTNDRITLPHAVFSTITGAAITVEAWVKIAAGGEFYQGIVTKFNNSPLVPELNLGMFSNPPKALCTVTNGTVVGTTSLPVGTWFHYAMVYNGSTLVVYVDGNPIGSVAATGNISLDTGAAYVGYMTSAIEEPGPFKGEVAEVRVWNTARTQAQLIAGMAAVTAPQSGLVGIWRLDEGSSTTANDASGNAYHGTLTNGPTWVSSIGDLIFGELRLWTTVRTPAEILANVNSITTPQTGLHALYRFNEKTGATAADSSGNAHTSALAAQYFWEAEGA